MRCCFDEKAGREALTATASHSDIHSVGRSCVMSSCHRAAAAAASYWAPFLPRPLFALRRFHLKTLPSVLSAFLSFFRGPLGGRSPFCDNLLLREREDGNHRTDPMHQGRTLSSPLLGTGGWSSSLSSLSFCGDEDYCSRSLCRSVGPFSLLSLLPIL